MLFSVFDVWFAIGAHFFNELLSKALLSRQDGVTYFKRDFSEEALDLWEQ